MGSNLAAEAATEETDNGNVILTPEIKLIAFGVLLTLLIQLLSLGIWNICTKTISLRMPFAQRSLANLTNFWHEKNADPYQKAKRIKSNNCDVPKPCKIDCKLTKKE